MFKIPFDDNIANKNVEYEDSEGKKLEVVDNLTYNYSFPTLMNFYGCHNAVNNDMMHWNQIKLILFKNSQKFEITAWNQTITAYPFMLGHIQIMNTAIEDNTEEENEVVFNDLIEYCQKVLKSENKNYIPTFDDVYSNNVLTPTSYYDPILIVGMILFLVIIFNCFGNDDNE